VLIGRHSQWAYQQDLCVRKEGENKAAEKRENVGNLMSVTNVDNGGSDNCLIP